MALAKLHRRFHNDRCVCMYVCVRAHMRACVCPHICAFNYLNISPYTESHCHVTNKYCGK